MYGCAHPSRTRCWGPRLLAFVGAAIVGLVAPSGCVVAPEGSPLTRESLETILWGPDDGCTCDLCAAADQAQCDEGEPAACEEPRRQAALARLHSLREHCHLPLSDYYDPEAGIFNFCVPSGCIQPPPPLPPGRFFPVPARPVFAPQPTPAYALPPGS